MVRTQSPELQRKIVMKRRNIVSLATAASTLTFNTSSANHLVTNTNTQIAAFTSVPALTSKYFAKSTIKKQYFVKSATTTGRRRRSDTIIPTAVNLKSTPGKDEPIDVHTHTNNRDCDTTTTTTTTPSDDTTKEKFTHSFDAQYDASIQIHTLVLGTHPSITSLAKSQYFGFPTNAFWWIAGDCLGFRRDSGLGKSGKPYAFSRYLLYGPEMVLPYEKQVDVLTAHGFALWDLLGSCLREGSLDVDIKEETPNAIREFCRAHPTIRRIVMANGAKQCTFFNRYFGDWWLSGELKPGENHQLSQKAFQKWGKKLSFEDASIEVFCMPGVSPAAASISYEMKREAFRQFCFDPGLLDHNRLKRCDGDIV